MAQNVTDETFEAEVLNSTLPVLVDFWAQWCGPCRSVGPLVEELAKDFEGRVKIVKFNVDEGKETPGKFGVRGIPTLMVFKGGKPVDQLVGAVPKSTIQDLLNKAMK
jgi:thioredoxin 1